MVVKLELFLCICIVRLALGCQINQMALRTAFVEVDSSQQVNPSFFSEPAVSQKPIGV